MDKRDIKEILLRWVSGVLALFFLAFGTTWKEQGFCLGDKIFHALGLPAWSKGAQGLHYPAIISLIAVLLLFHLFASTTRDPKKVMGYLILGTFLLLYFIGGLI